MAGQLAREGSAGSRPVPVLGDAERVWALARSGLSEVSEAEMEHHARRVRDSLGVPVALVSLVHPEQQVFPGMVGLGEPWATARCTPLSHSFCQYVVAGKQPLVISDAREHPWVMDNPAISDLGVIAYAGMPLIDAAGRVLGSLCAIDTVPRRWSDTELQRLSHLADECSTELQARVSRRDDARERSRGGKLEASLQAAVRRGEMLLAASQSLAQASSFEDLRIRAGQVVISTDLAPEYLSLVIAGEDGQLHRIPDPVSGPGPEDFGPWRDFGSATPLPSAAVMDSPRILHYTDRQAFAADYPPAVLELIVKRGLHAITVVPLLAERGPVGALVLGWQRPRDDSLDLMTITSIAGLLAQAVGRVRLLAHRISVAHELQAAMLSTLPDVDGLTLGARYVPADVRAEVGGDWYDVVRLPTTGTPAPAPVAVSVGDIVGHDMHAATIMGQVRAMLRQACWSSACESPAAALSELEAACAGIGVEAAGTALLARLDPSIDGTGRWTMTWSNAGHLPPLILRPDGTTMLLEDHDMLFGYRHLVRGPRRDHRIVLDPGTVVLLYTDGLVEQRARDIDTGIAALRDLLATLRGRAPRDIVDIVVDALVVDAHDDAAALAVALDPPALDPPVLGSA